MRMLRWSYGRTMLDTIQNKVFRIELGVVSIIDKLRGRIVWFGHIHRRQMSAPVNRVERIKIER